VADAWNKVFVEHPAKFRKMSWSTRQIYLALHGYPIEPDGTVAEMQPGESPHAAITKALGVTAKNERRPFKNAIEELLAEGFLFVDGDRVMFPNWEARKVWRGGEIPSPVGARLEPNGNRPGTKLEPAGNQPGTKTEHPTEANPAESNGAKKRNAFEPLGQANTVQGGRGIEGGGSPGDAPASSDGAEVVDLKTGEVIDPADFYDPPPEERERLAAELPPEAPTPDEADEAAGLFDVEEGATF
jgi:hypothetical protein